jgi:hypothetical protein
MALANLGRSSPVKLAPGYNLFTASLMNPFTSRPLWFAVPALALGALLASCSSQPAATDTEKTAVVVPDDKSAPVTVDSAKTDSTKSTAPAQ